MKPLVIYHANCTDGFGAAWAFSRLFGHDGCEWHAARHGDPPPDVWGRDVFIVDFSYPRGRLVEMHCAAQSLLVLDHHKSAEADLAGLGFCEFDMDRSGAGLALDYLASHYEGLQRNWLIDYVEDRDLWRFALPDSKDVSKYLLTLPPDFEVWDRVLAEETPATCAERGRVMREYDEYLLRWTLKGTHRLSIGGHNVPAVNSTVLASEVGHELAKGEPFAAVYFMRADGRLGFSLRSESKDAVDVGAVAGLYGGGGHHCAAGFSVPSLAALVLAPTDVMEPR